MKKVSKKLISLALTMAVLFSLAVPFSLPVSTEEEAAEGSEIYALLYDVRSRRSLPVQFQPGERDGAALKLRQRAGSDPTKKGISNESNRTDLFVQSVRSFFED